MAAALSKRPIPEPERGDGSMPLLEHLEELRTRIIKSLASIAVGVGVAFLFINRLVEFLLAPIRRMLPAGSSLIYTSPGEAFSFYVTTAFIAGLLLAAPFVMFQVWQFIAPGLYAKEKRLAIPFVALTTSGAVGGAAFGHYVLFPSMIAFLGTFSSPTLTFMPRIEEVFDLYTKMILGMIVVFQIPTLAFFLARMRVVTARWLWRNVKYAVLVIFIVAAFLTPSGDPWNQSVFAAPMVVLYLLSIVIAWLAAPRRSDEPVVERNRQHADLPAIVLFEAARAARFEAARAARRRRG
jgi:sec-independent protein translocase protein TatC